jgi:hypothetical protein
MFALVHVEPRYLAGWLIMLFSGCICASLLPNDAGIRREVERMAVALLIIAGASLISQASKEALRPDYAAGRTPNHALIADFLLHRGLHPGDRVAVIGYGTEAYWAHLARLRVIAEIPPHITAHQTHPAFDFWESGHEQQQKALTIIEQTGAKAVIAGSQISPLGSVPSLVPPPWKKIDGTDFCAYFFPDQP